jgi:hypothetical protein
VGPRLAQGIGPRLHRQDTARIRARPRDRHIDQSDTAGIGHSYHHRLTQRGPDWPFQPLAQHRDSSVGGDRLRFRGDQRRAGDPLGRDRQGLPPRKPAEGPGGPGDPLRVRCVRLRLSPPGALVETKPDRHSRDRPAAARDHLHRDRLRYPPPCRGPLPIPRQYGQRRRHRVDLHRQLHDHRLHAGRKNRPARCHSRRIAQAVHRHDRRIGRTPAGGGALDLVPSSIDQMGDRVPLVAFRNPEEAVPGDPKPGGTLDDIDPRPHGLFAHRHVHERPAGPTGHHGPCAVHRHY